MVRMGSAVGTAEALMRKPSSSRHLTSPLTVPRELRRCRLAWRSPPTRSHGGSQGFKSPHLHPQLARQSVASVEQAALTAGCGDNADERFGLWSRRSADWAVLRSGTEQTAEA